MWWLCSAYAFLCLICWWRGEKKFRVYRTSIEQNRRTEIHNALLRDAELLREREMIEIARAMIRAQQHEDTETLAQLNSFYKKSSKVDWKKEGF